MAGTLSGGYFPLYPHHDNLPDPERIRTFITNFYRMSDKPDANELWISYFTKDADVVMGSDKAKGEQEIRELRSRMWNSIHERKHTVTKVFPARFQAPPQPPSSAHEPADAAAVTVGGTLAVAGDAGNAGQQQQQQQQLPLECECMMFGHVERRTRDGREDVTPWAGHAVIRQERRADGEQRGEWKMAHYQVWLQQ